MKIPTYLTGTTQAQAYRILRGNVYNVLRQYKLTPTDWSVLGMIIDAREGARASEIAFGLHIKAPQITLITQELIDRTLIKSVPHQFDGRAKLLALTPSGKRLVKNVEASLESMLGDLLQGLSDDDLVAYYKVLTTIIANDPDVY